MADKVSIEYGAEDISGAAEAAEILGVATPQISRWEKAGKMPKPLRRLKATAVWLTADIIAKRDREGRG
jgi:predicted site-specific integrase-resolvase